MAILGRLEDFLKESGVSYESVTHPEAFTAQEVAAAMHVKGKDLAKAVIIKAGDRLVMTVLPASRRVDFSRLKAALGEKEIRLASEDEFKGLFENCEPGGEPPFGNIFGMETLVDESLAEDERIFFNAGNHRDAVGMGYGDYVRLVRPRVAGFAAEE
ncbi:MAG: aminoacyl-tRNA deacylase [Thermodesulfobacteriota bacterium]